jgi:hypothetical protein
MLVVLIPDRKFANKSQCTANSLLKLIINIIKAMHETLPPVLLGIGPGVDGGHVRASSRGGQEERLD